MFGYSSKSLSIDLATGRSESIGLDSELAEMFLGDFGINARLAYDLIKPGVNPLVLMRSS